MFWVNISNIDSNAVPLTVDVDILERHEHGLHQRVGQRPQLVVVELEPLERGELHEAVLLYPGDPAHRLVTGLLCTETDSSLVTLQP